ncbi:MAG: lysostaphin resistance A-like protein, partial [Candidatus Thorarchaeota archaeon]
SNFAEHLPISYGALLIIVPLIAYLTVNVSENRNLPTFSRNALVIIFILGILGITIVTTSPTMGVLDWNIFNFLFLVPIFLTLVVFKIPRKDLGFRGSIRDVKYSVLLGVIYGALVFLAVGYNELIEFLKWTEPYDPDIIPVLPQSIMLASLIAVMFIALPEEFFFRVIVQSGLSERIGAARGLLLASLIFGLFHIPANFMFYFAYFGNIELSVASAILVSFIAQSQIGIILGVAWYRTRSLVLPVTLHAVHDIVEMLPVFIALSLGAIII